MAYYGIVNRLNAKKLNQRIHHNYLKEELIYHGASELNTLKQSLNPKKQLKALGPEAIYSQKIIDYKQCQLREWLRCSKKEHKRSKKTLKRVL